MKTKRKIKIDMSVEMDVLFNENPIGDKKEWLNTIAKNYIECLGDNHITIENVDFV